MKTPYILNDYDVMDILENLNLEEKLNLRTVSKQFNECVNRVLKSQKVLYLYIKDIDREEDNNVILEDDYQLEIKEILSDQSVQVLDMNQIKEQFEPLLRSFETLTVLKLRLNRSNIWYFEWLANIFPHLKSIEISFIGDDNWDINKLLTFKEFLGPKCEKVMTFFFNNIGELKESGLMSMPSIRTIDIDRVDIESLEEIFNHLTPNIRSISFCSDLENNRVLEALIAGNGKYVEKLEITDYGTSFENQMLRRIFRDIPGIKTLILYLVFVTSLQSLSYAQNLEELSICLDINDGREPMLTFPTNCTFVLANLRKLEIEESILYPEFCLNIEKSFPNIEFVSLISFTICCRCRVLSLVCLKCYQQFISDCKSVYERKIIFKKKSIINLTYKLMDEKVIVLMSIIDEFFVSDQSLNCILSDSILEPIYSITMNAVIQIAFRKPDINVCFKVGSNIYPNIKNSGHILPSNVKLQIVEKEYVLENQRNKGNEYCIHLYQLYCDSDIMLKLGSNTSISKRIQVYFDY